MESSSPLLMYVACTILTNVVQITSSERSIDVRSQRSCCLVVWLNWAATVDGDIVLVVRGRGERRPISLTPAGHPGGQGHSRAEEPGAAGPGELRQLGGRVGWPDLPAADDRHADLDDPQQEG